MKIRALLLTLTIVLVCATNVFAQDDKVEITVDYSFVHFNPQNNNIIGTFNLNGGGGSIAYYFSKYVGIEGDFQGYGSYTKYIHSTNPTYCPEGCQFTAQGNLFTYDVGPVFKYRTEHFEPFGEVLFGGAHSNFYGNVYKGCLNSACLAANKTPSNNAWDFMIGGGVDIPLTPKITIRPAEFDYLLTRFGNAFTHGNNNQSNLRYQAGVQFRF
ncbi:MAG TPA: outer membrane beta-barrel protein [Candidatus Acidoferrum sp.]|nr:outer membrane beta-barrel protein [Candidatus Acidoferrum sp.]